MAMAGSTIQAQLACSVLRKHGVYVGAAEAYEGTPVPSCSLNGMNPDPIAPGGIAGSRHF
jgi:hypothetical protein